MPRPAPTTSRFVPRFMGGSTLFNGTTSTIPTTLTANTAFTGGFTLSAWMNPTSGGEGTGGRIIDKSELDSALNGVKLQILTASGTFLLRTAGTSVQSAANSVRYKKWQHVITSVASDATVSFYINGVLSGTPAAGGPLANITTANALTIGNRSGATDFTFDGKIAEVKIYNAALTAAQALTLYTTGSVPDVTPVADYDLDDQPSTYIDSIGGNNGTGTATTYSTDVPIGLRPSQSDDKASANGSAISAVGSIDTVTSNAGSVLGMAYIPGNAAVTIINFFKADGASSSWRFNMEGNTRYPFIWTTNTAGSGTTNPKPSLSLPKDKWFHFAVVQTISGGNVTGKIYINGQLRGQQTQTRDVDTCSRFAVNTNTGVYTNNILAYEREVIQQEIKDHCFNRIVPASPKIRWDRQEGAGNTNYDSSGNGYDGTGGTLTWSSDTPSKARTVVGGNLVKNGDFEYAPPFTAETTADNVFIDGTGGGSATNSIFNWSLNKIGTVAGKFDSSEKKTGGYSLKLSTKATGSYIESGIAQGVTKTRSRLIPVLPNTPYTLSFWMKTNFVSGDATNGARMSITQMNGALSNITGNASIAVKTTTDWTRYTVTFTTNVNTRFVDTVMLVYGHEGAATLIMDAWFDDITLTKTTPDTRPSV